MSEIWRPVKNFDGVYSVSNVGRVRRDSGGRGAMRGRILTPKRKQNGYFQVDLSKNDKKVRRLIHQLVAEAFLPPRPSNEHHPNHLDGVKTNNVSTNLEWATLAENNAHARRLGLVPSCPGEKNGRAKLSSEDVIAIRNLKGAMTQRQIASRFGVARTMVQRIHQGNAWNVVQ